MISGEHRAQVAWRTDGAAPQGGSELVLNVVPQGPVRFIEQSTTSGRSETYTLGNTGAQYFSCGDRLAVDAELTLTTPDGSLNESLEASVEAESDGYALVSARLPEENVVGSLRALLQQQGAEALSLSFGISELGTGLEGTLGLVSEETAVDESGQSERCSLAGSFKLAQGCPLGSFPLGSDEELRGLSFAKALAHLNATSPATLLDDGGELSLAFTAEPQPTCLSIDTPDALPSVLLFPGRVQLSSADGRVGGALEVQLRAEARGGVLQSVSAQTDYLVPDPSGLSQLARNYAILEPLDWSQGEIGGFEFQVEARQQDSGGLLRALGGNLGCQSARPCEEVCPGPGCTMTTAEKWAVRWGEMAVGAELPPQTGN